MKSESRPKRPVAELAHVYADDQKENSSLGELEFAGAGGEHVVFRFKQKEGREGEHRNLLVKAQMKFLERGAKRALLENKDHLNPDTSVRVQSIDDRSAEESMDDEYMKVSIEREKDFFKTLGRVFPSESILETRAVIRKVPLTPKFLKTLLVGTDLEDSIPDETIDVKTILRYQRPIPEGALNDQEGGSNPDAHSFGFSYAERFDIPPSEYGRFEQMTRSLGNEIDMDLFSNFLHQGTLQLIEKAKTDDELKSVLQDFVRKSMKLTQKFEEMTDLAGGGNIRIFKDSDEKWQYVFVDPHANNNWRTAKDTIVKARQNPAGISSSEASDLLNALNYERTLNGMAKLLGMDDRLFLDNPEDPMSETSAKNVLLLLRSKNSWPDRFDFIQKAKEDVTAPRPIKTPV